MVDKLLRPGGWIIFDDLWWTSAREEARTGLKTAAGVPHDQLADDEYREAHVEAIFRLLVMQHPAYARFRVLDEILALAQKTSGDTKQIRFESMVSLKYKLVSLVKKLSGRSRKQRFSHRPSQPAPGGPPPAAR